MSSSADKGATKIWKRSFKACINCRQKKVKCDLGPLDNPHKPPCERCRREQRECIFQNTNNRNLRTSNHSTYKLQDEARGFKGSKTNKPQLSKLKDSSWYSDVSSMQTTLEYLATAADSLSQAEDRNTLQKVNSESSSRENLTANETILSPLLSYNGSQTKLSSLIEKVNSIRPKINKKLSDITYIGPYGLLIEEEAVALIEMFFITLHPFFPYIPIQLQDPEELVRYPILLCAILTISARYNSLEDLGLKTRDDPKYHIIIHEKLWMYCQRLISRTIWAEASTRSIGTVLAFLLFTEWNPRAIHWNWFDYASTTDNTSFNNFDDDISSNNLQGENITGFEAMRHSDRMAWMLTGSAIRLAQDMHFIDVSNKIFLATHISETYNAMNVNQRSSLSESLSNVNMHNKSINLNKYPDSKSSYERTLRNERFYLEQILKKDDSKGRWFKFLNEFKSNGNDNNALSDKERDFLNDEYALYYLNSDSNNNNQDQPSLPLEFTISQRAKIELLRIMSIGYETIYYDKGKRNSTQEQKQNLALLNIFSALIESWFGNYHTLLKPSSGGSYDSARPKDRKIVYQLSQNIENESLICDYYYCQLYIYSLALQLDSEVNQLKLRELSKSAKYVSLAYNAAKELLYSAERIKSLKLLKFIPVRWVIRIVRSVSFIVKCHVTVTDADSSHNKALNSILSLSGILPDESLALIQKAAVLLKDTAPDELHLCTRYSKILLYLYKELKDNKKQNQQNNETDSPKYKNDGQYVENSNKIYNDITFDTVLRNEFKTPSSSQVELASVLNNETIMNKVANTKVTEVAPTNPPNTTPITLNNPQNASFPNEVIDWFSTSADIGLEFVESWTEMIEQRYINSSDAHNTDFDDLLKTIPN